MCLGYRLDTEADRITVESFNGRTLAFEAGYGGSSPSSQPSTKIVSYAELCVPHDKVNDEVVTPENLDAKLKAAFEKAFEISFDFIERWKK